MLTCLCQGGGGKCAITEPIANSLVHRLVPHFLYNYTLRHTTLTLSLAHSHTHVVHICMCAWRAHIHTDIQLMRFFEELLLQQRWHKPFSSYLWPSISYNTHSYTQAPCNRPSHSRFIQSLISFHQISPPLFSFPPFYSAGYFFVPDLYPSFSTSHCCLSHLCLIFIILSLASLFFLLLYCFHHRPSCSAFICFLFSRSFVFLSLPLALSLSPILYFLYSAPSSLAFFFSSPSWPLTLYFLFFVLCPSHFLQSLSLSLWVSGLCGNTAPGREHLSEGKKKNWKQTVKSYMKGLENKGGLKDW